MISEDFEFRISQYADGTLSAEEASALEAELATNSEARALLEEYRKLNATLKHALPLPAINFDRLADHLSDAVAAADDQPAVTIKLFAWTRAAQVAIAATILLVIGSAAWLTLRPAQPLEQIVISGPQTAPTPLGGLAIVEVSGPSIESAAQPAVVEVAIGPSDLAKQQPLTYAAEDIIYRAPRVVIASTAVKRQDTVASLPF